MRAKTLLKHSYSPNFPSRPNPRPGRRGTGGPSALVHAAGQDAAAPAAACLANGGGSHAASVLGHVHPCPSLQMAFKLPNSKDSEAAMSFVKTRSRGRLRRVFNLTRHLWGCQSGSAPKRESVGHPAAVAPMLTARCCPSDHRRSPCRCCASHTAVGARVCATATALERLPGLSWQRGDTAQAEPLGSALLCLHACSSWHCAYTRIT